MQERELAFERPVVSELDHGLGAQLCTQLRGVGACGLNFPHTFSIFAVDSGLGTRGCVCVCAFITHGSGVVSVITDVQGVRI